MSRQKIIELEQEIAQLTAKLRNLQDNLEGVEVPDYEFETTAGVTTLGKLFGSHQKLLVIHNMGQGCRYCTLWGDGINGFLPHLESAMSVVMLSKDSPSEQRKFAQSRQWRFQMASHGGGKYMQEQVAAGGMDNMPGVVCYERDNYRIIRKNASYFGPGDLYCSIWHFLGLAGFDLEDWTPQFNYWLRPAILDDGGKNIIEP